MNKRSNSETTTSPAEQAPLGDGRSCDTCRHSFSADESRRHHAEYFDPPYGYADGCRERCLACWLGVGPADVPDAWPAAKI